MVAVWIRVAIVRSSALMICSSWIAEYETGQLHREVDASYTQNARDALLLFPGSCRENGAIEQDNAGTWMRRIDKKYKSSLRVPN